ncbi:helix-turn-helix transcriptional regulator [Dinghuibacter silviterrae]|uniref:AraC-like DNA-binding protein n=1 Tax=Dinghuibacter silviterrae TaxID=1539049 RepID=A0A4R8DSD5_9BACT|nr:helix-turn-helix transcriptional regulator [Dinghuibacter silviterrae]TDX00325.1 AraC-like DNA-binding protein [Dinghuibacter silviterrae]
MSYAEYPPSEPLKPFVDAYWLRLSTGRPGTRRVYADGCADLMVNLGASMAYFAPKANTDKAIALQPGRLFLGGTMTEYGLLQTAPDTVLTGIRFKPGGLYTLYRVYMETAVDGLVEFSDPVLRPLMELIPDRNTRLDAYLEGRIRKTRYDFPGIYDMLCGEPQPVADLACRCHVSPRTLERIFKRNVGIAPKQYIRIARFQEVLRHLKSAGEESLLRMAYDLGYHDHAHLTNEFKRYAGILPSELSRFYKTGISRGQYF